MAPPRARSAAAARQGKRPQPVPSSAVAAAVEGWETSQEAASPPVSPRQRKPPPLPQLQFSSKAEERWFSQPKIAALVEKMRDLGDAARTRAKTRQEKLLLAKYYSNDGLKRRVKLLFEPQVVNALERIWQAADTDGSHAIEKGEYLVMHRKLVLALDPSTPPKLAFEAAEEDWVKDSEGKHSLDKDRFFWCWFELAVRARTRAAIACRWQLPPPPP